MQSYRMVEPTLSGVAETLLIALYNRAMESQRPDAIMKHFGRVPGADSAIFPT